MFDHFHNTLILHQAIKILIYIQDFLNAAKLTGLTIFFASGVYKNSILAFRYSTILDLTIFEVLLRRPLSIVNDSSTVTIEADIHLEGKISSLHFRF